MSYPCPPDELVFVLWAKLTDDRPAPERGVVVEVSKDVREDLLCLGTKESSPRAYLLAKRTPSPVSPIAAAPLISYSAFGP